MRPNKNNHYAIVDCSGRIHRIHKTRASADAIGCGHDREMVQLITRHKVGDVISWNDSGIEVPAKERLS